MIVKLIKGYAYGDGVVFVKKDNPIIEVADDEGQKLLASGYFEEVTGPAPAPTEEEKEYIVTPVDFDKMTVNELKAYAAENDIDISGLTKKADIKAALIAAKRGHQVTLFEAKDRLGGQLNFADYAPFKHSLAK